MVRRRTVVRRDFNGSAVRRPRLAVASASKIRSGEHFNGSAVRRPRLAQVLDAFSTITWTLQWVRGPKTAVSVTNNGREIRRRALQWVRGPKTAVSDVIRAVEADAGALQWVRGPKTAVSSDAPPEFGEIDWTSMGPRSEDRG